MLRIAKSLLTIVAVAAIATTATGAYFSDQEVVTGNSFVAGSLNLEVGTNGTIPFAVADVTPGQTGNGKISLTNTGSLPGSLDVNLQNFLQFENTLLEPELNPGYGTADYPAGPNAGELNFFLGMAAYVDVNHNASFDAGDIQLAYNGQAKAYPGYWGGTFNYHPVSSNLTPWNDVMTMAPGQTVDIVVMWQFPAETVGGNYSQNIAMSDSLTFDIVSSLMSL